MSLTDRLFGRSAGVSFALPAVQAKLAAAVRDGVPADPELTRARLADAFRDAGLVPPLPEEADAAAAGLDAEGAGRFAALVAVLDLDEVRGSLMKMSVAGNAAELAARLAGVARDSSLLTAEILRQSELRLEELARRLIAGLGAGVAGETAAKSKERLERIDYGRLLAEAERAKAAAAERVAELERLRNEQARRTRRGKW